MLLELLGLLLVTGFCLFIRAKNIIWIPLIAISIFMIMVYGRTPFYLYVIYWAIFFMVVVFGSLPAIRLNFIARPFFNYFKKVLPPISQTEREAIDAGDTYWEADLFQGRPDWDKLHAIQKPGLTTEEQAFVDNQVDTLCGLLNDWKIVYEDNDMPENVWQYLKKEKFFGLVIEKKYGGLGFTALAHSTIVAKIASRSLSTAINTMVPNSLGPGELLHRYGTDKQKQYYLPRLASGEEIPCFALTSLDAGSDAGAMTDTGVVCKQQINGKDVIGIKLNFSKRYITLAPVASLIGLAFKLRDPEHLLGNNVELGITVALLDANMSGVTTGKRHFPMSLAFMNGPIEGKDVFVEFDAIIGGKERIGQGWRMLMECLSIGRSISLPALSTAASVLAYRSTGAYAALRHQFRMPIGKFEGIAESMALIAGNTYTLLASRLMTCGAVDEGCKPSVASAIAKYHSTEMSRKVIDNALDIHGGRGIQNGPNNYLANIFAGGPVAITVEGANILTRNLIIFGQGAIRCHPYILNEMQAVQDNSLKQFDQLLVKHIVYAASNVVRSLTFSLTNAFFVKTPTKKIIKPYYRQLTRMSSALAMVSDIAMLVLGGNLKRKESLSARLGDVLSALYLSSSVLKYFSDRNMPEDELPHVQWALDKQLANIQLAFNEFFDNFPTRWLAGLLRWIVFPYGRCYRGPSTNLSQKLAKHMMRLGESRDQLTKLCYIGAADQPLAILEQAVALQVATEPLLTKLKMAIKAGKVANNSNIEIRIKDAVVADIITEQEGQLLREYEIVRVQALSVDEFPADYFNKR